METKEEFDVIIFFDEFKDAYVIDKQQLILDTIKVHGVSPEDELVRVDFTINVVKNKYIVIPKNISSKSFVRYTIAGKRLCKVTKIQTEAKSFVSSKDENGYVNFEFVENK